jgi:PAS domain S-box-containing protein
MSVSQSSPAAPPLDQSIRHATGPTGFGNNDSFRLVADIAPVPIWMSDADKRCTYVNKAWLAFTGRTLEAELGDGWYDCIHPDDLPKRLETLTAAFDRREPFKVEYRLGRHDHEYRWVLDTGVPLILEGSFGGYIGSCVDITDLKHAQTELVYSADRLRLSLESGKSLAWEWDLESGRDSCFGDLRTIFGIVGTTLVGRIDDFRQGLHPDDRDRVLTAIDEAERRGTQYEEEFRIRRPDDTVRWVAARGRFYYATDGRATHMRGIATDVTERKRAEELLRRKESELTEAQRLAAIGSWQWDRSTDDVVWSKELYRIAGLEPGSPTALDARNHPQLYPPDDWERIRRCADEALRSGTPYELDVEMISSGSRRWVTARGEAQRDADGRISGLRGTVQDITERKQSQQALSDSEERLRLAAEAGHMFAYTWDAATDAITRSGKSSHILGIDAETPVTGEQMLARIHPDDRARVLAALGALRPEHPQLLISYRLIRPDGLLIWVERSSRSYFDDTGNLVRIVGMVADVTQRKHAEEVLSNVSRRLLAAQEAERARIARDLHDDIGQRLALLSIGFDELQRSSSDPASEHRSHIDALQRQTVEIASDIQALAHELHSYKVQLFGVVAAMRGFCSDSSIRQNVEVDFTHQDVPATVPPDIAICLFRVLQEALRNAVRHSGARRFTVSFQGTPDGFSLTVCDAGRGFDAEAASHEAGLGLTSMRERLKLVAGELLVESQPGRGTTIVARVPLSTASPLTRGELDA